MATIEERALAFGEQYEGSPHRHFAEECYEIGATEQKSIDKKLILDAYCKRCQDMGGGYPCSHKCYEYIEFEKTMED